MKINKIILILIVTFIILLITNIKSYGAIAIVKDGLVFTGMKISQCFDMCKEMTSKGRGLEGATVDVHLATNGDWATVSYFSNSNYGTATQGQNSGVAIDIDGQEFLSTNGNLTGVMDWGKTITYTAGIISNYGNIEEGTDAYNNGKSLILNAESNNVEKFNVNTTDKITIASTGWYGEWNSMGEDPAYPYSVRRGLFGFAGGNKGNHSYYGAHYTYASGAAESVITFRPVILN